MTDTMKTVPILLLLCLSTLSFCTTKPGEPQGPGLPGLDTPVAETVPEAAPPLIETVIEKELLYDQHTLADTYPYKDTMREFQWDKIRAGLRLLDSLRQKPSRWAIFQNYRNKNERLRSTRICKELTLKYGLHIAGGKENVKRNRLKEPDRTRYRLYDILKTEVGRCGNWNVLVANLNRQGVEVRFKHKGQTNEVQGVVFTMNGYRFNGSKVDRRFSYSKIDAALQRNRYEERMNLKPKDYGMDTPNATSDTAKGELFNGSLGLLGGNGSSYNANDAEANQEMVEMLRRKKRKRGMRL